MFSVHDQEAHNRHHDNLLQADSPPPPTSGEAQESPGEGEGKAEERGETRGHHHQHQYHHRRHHLMEMMTKVY